MSGLAWVWTAVTAVLALPAVVLWLQIVAAAWPGRVRRGAGVNVSPTAAARARLAILVPAHNEHVGIQATLRAIQAQLRPGDRLLVVADNCSDDTAALARQAGAEVTERHDPVRRGKGYALDHGVRHLSADAPQILVMLDADCIAHPGALDALAAEASTSGRPAQALYLMQAPASPARAGLKVRAAQFAWRVKNHARPLGLRRCGGPCQLMGTGMAFPWALIAHAPLASGHLVEDMQLGIDLALAGKPPRFVPEALVTSTFPETDAGAASQRTRWEHGHIATLLVAGPRLLGAGLRLARPSVVALAVDLMVPPLALLLLMHLLLGVANLLGAAMFGWSAPLVLSALALMLLGSAIVLAWCRFGRDVISLGELATAPLYALRKLPMYAAFLKNRQAEWVRAKRHGE
jgi:cellulose synthase/poly-beta-1,6-N-acetylglucosamine synthase-like glycosyltransferase